MSQYTKTIIFSSADLICYNLQNTFDHFFVPPALLAGWCRRAVVDAGSGDTVKCSLVIHNVCGELILTLPSQLHQLPSPAHCVITEQCQGNVPLMGWLEIP